jgi:hypothetical protein
MKPQDVDAERYRELGYIFPISVFDEGEVDHLRRVYWRLRGLLPPGESTQKMDWWHTLDRELWEICTHPRILDSVEAILGPDFYLWGSQFLDKEPGDEKTVPWHQDAYFWPLSPHHAVTVWLAVEDSFKENGAMQVVPGTHRAGRLQHRETDKESDILNMVLEEGTFNESEAVTLALKAGQMSLHDDNIVHGSGPNLSDRLRCGLTMRFSAGEVAADTNEWPYFKAYWARGEDRWGHNPIGTPPTSLMTAYAEVTWLTGQK